MSKRFPLPILRHSEAGIKDHFKISLGAIVYPIQTRRWRSFLHDNPMLGELARQYPRIIHKIYRPYLSKHLRCADRVDLMIGHYSYMFEAGLGELICEAARHPVSVAEFAGKAGTLFRIQLSSINVGHREGELTLQLIYAGECVYAASFTLADLNGATYIRLGALQGLRSADGAQVIKNVTRELHGCRPKKLMVSVVRDIGAYFGCSKILLVSNKNRVSINGRRSSRISSNYDETWEEMLACKRPDGNFELPCVDALQKNLDLVPSHKRSEARRRNALLASVCETIRAFLEMRKSPVAPPSAGDTGPASNAVPSQVSADRCWA